MSVLECDRNGCESIMCDYYSHRHGYICNSCLEELKLKPWINIANFMLTEKQEVYDNYGDWESYLDREFERR